MLHRIVISQQLQLLDTHTTPTTKAPFPQYSSMYHSKAVLYVLRIIRYVSLRFVRDNIFQFDFQNITVAIIE